MKVSTGVATLGVVAGLALVARELDDYRQRSHRRASNAGVRHRAAVDVGGEPAPAGAHVAIVIAAYDEVDGIADVLDSLPEFLSDLPVRVVVVDDGSADGTAALAEAAGASVAVHERNLGQGDALRTGFQVALDGGATVVVTMDADGQHDPAQLDDLVAPVVEGIADYVQGSRFLGEYDDAGSARDAGIRLFTTVINLVGRTSITDCTNGFRAIRADGLSRMRLEEDRFSAPELILEARHRGLVVLERPVHIRARDRGESKKPTRLGYPVGFARAVVEVRLRQLVD
ncbi:MAG: glycosyltransferase family 2 protein [Acidimicrobiales bacterium]|nr:glycosyltransferase family 2 protein [Acidimicrobiales bacterium]